MAPFRQVGADKCAVQRYGDDFVYSVSLIAKRLGLITEWRRSRALLPPDRASEGKAPLHVSHLSAAPLFTLSALPWASKLRC